ncbi:hypothetical protein B0H11DRAFT_1901306 [Mycena galericulata]|nr:hypothetical protein B0H11DRAFT_1901306 [Mycena galericulata]
MMCMRMNKPIAITCTVVPVAAMLDIHIPPRVFRCEECGTLDAVFKSCGGCRLAHYCSLDCQKAAWKQRHRAGCFKHTYMVHATALCCAFWKVPFLRWALLACDLASKPPDFLLNHSALFVMDEVPDLRADAVDATRTHTPVRPRLWEFTQHNKASVKRDYGFVSVPN